MPDAVAVVCADTHLQRRTWKHRPIMGDSYHSFRQIVDAAIKRRLPIIGAGDLIDKRVNEPDPIVFLTHELRRLDDAGLTYFFIQGQHELDSTPWFNIGPNVEHVHDVLFQLGPLALYGLDFQPKDKFHTRLAAVPEEAQVLIAHQVWGDLMGDLCLPQGDFADVPTNIELVITGDYHEETILDTYRGAGGQRMRVFNPGSTCMQKIDEPPDKRFGVLYDDGSIKKVKLRTRKFDEFTVAGQKDVDEFLTYFEAYLDGAADYATDNQLPADLHKPLWRISYPHRLSSEVNRIRDAVGDQAHLFWNERAPSREEARAARNIVNVPEVGQALTLESCLDDAVDPDTRPETHALAQRLLQAGATKEDKTREAKKWLKEQLDE